MVYTLERNSLEATNAVSPTTTISIYSKRCLRTVVGGGKKNVILNVSNKMDIVIIKILWRRYVLAHIHNILMYLDDLYYIILT